MAKLNLRIVPDPVLREKCAAVNAMDQPTAQTLRDMLETMYKESGIGLAAPQVGITKRLIVIDLQERAQGEATYPLLMANPEITWSDPDETFTYHEGCLSIPKQYADVTRPKRVRVRYLDDQGVARELQAEDLLSSCIQHEIDHLNGVLFVDYLSPLKRKMILRRVEKHFGRNDDEPSADM